MIDKISKILLKIFGSRNERMIKSYSVIAQEAGEFEESVKGLDDDALSAKTAEFKEVLKRGGRPEDILPEAFAVVREAARRNVDMRHFDVQLIGGNVLYEGKIAEMVTGEGKTLVATLAVYLVYLTGRKVHLVTVNDYLAKRDAEWMGPIYEALGLTVGAIQADMDTMGDERRAQYDCDVTYGTNNEFGFDYLRDNMKMSLEQMVQGELQFAIIDEVDSILIDEARTPLIISGPAFDDVSRYKEADQVARKLMAKQSGYDRLKKQIDSAQRKQANAQGELAEAKRDKDNKRIEKAQKVIGESQRELERAEAELAGATEYYEVEYDKKSAHLTHEGVGAAQEIAGIGSFFTGSNMEWPHLLEQSLRAHVTFEKEKDYVVMDGKVIIVDEFTGRLMHGRQWSDGLHQAVEAKEGVTIKKETQTLATITLQNFFKLYDQISGMTGTAATEGEEFMKIYDLDVVVIPTNEPCIRDDMEDVIYKSMREKFNAILEEINEVSNAGRPVLVGTVSVEKNEALSAALEKRLGLEHEVLNAKHHEREAAIVAKAGHQHKGRDGRMLGNVTIATNMAGRGTDIKLGEGVADIGGLHVLGTERHEARRIDNQLRGRTGRQGDAGSSEFFLSFDDDLMSIFAPEWTVKALSWIGWEEGQPIAHKRISKGIEKAQKKVEERNFEVRKSLLEYDEVMDYQRKIFYGRRRTILAGKKLKNIIEEMVEATIAENCETILSSQYPLKCIVEWARTSFGVDLKVADIAGIKADEIEQLIKRQAKGEAENNISLSLGEYLEDYEDVSSWDVAGLCKWAMSAFRVSLSPSKVKEQEPEEIEEQLISAAGEQIDKKDCSKVDEFLRKDFGLRTFAEWARSKFNIKLDLNQLENLSVSEIREQLKEKTTAKYKEREINYPVEFAMNMVYGPQGANVYAFESLAEWANKKYNAGFSVEQIQNINPKQLHKQLLELSEGYNNGRLKEEIDDKLYHLDTPGAVDWANERFGVSFTKEELGHGEQRKEMILEAGREFLRSELSDLERYVLIQVYDSTWKDHLYTMDHLKSSIWMRSMAEKDPKTEYKREGHRMFQEMLSTIEDRVTDIIFKVRLEAGAQARSVWNVSQTAHDEVGQFAMAERQRAAAQAPQGEQKVKQIRLESPKVGRNEPCPCGSGKKYKKCCGKNV
ncbi:MAG: preprotein translocase subunit SecA [Phycisphaerae bacterium]|nr:preprotein translocase subunit SecA [Phycisphaerae bacterium]NIP55474.1 preprotein translocase subunit SecA [Phycisphaerae bacterium]NIS54179.1 preprotein translocase subunit SecA [Phycisphaerae bacterium]NIU11783.1 preprotein translocase subunit SecA [Phycisphaerae bacterium]NIU59606.1 preprotein translocase subunit SecA [Phycisphaerae bacterium]